MRIIVTGEIGIGKTTACEKLVAEARVAGYRCSGILTPKVEKDGSISQIDIIDIQNEEREVLASVDDIYDGDHIGRYFFNPQGIIFGVRAIEKGVRSDVLVVDEIGFLELAGKGFVKALALTKSGAVRNSIVVIRKQLLPAFLPQLGEPLAILETTIQSRDDLPSKILASLS